MNKVLILIGKIVSIISKILNFGSGSTWPGHIALSLNKNFIKQVLKRNQFKIILIAGTNGKTTTGKLIQNILEKYGKKVFQNAAGANLLNGIASTLISNSNLQEKINKDFAIFEIDENTLPLILWEINNPDFIIILNLFRDQLDRYGEVNTISCKWHKALERLNGKTTLILNADDPQIAYLASNLKDVRVKYFGIDSGNSTSKIQHASDSTYCPNCGEKLIYNSVYFSHLGDWICKKCNFKHPEKTFTKSSFYPLSGLYNEYNTNAAFLLGKQVGVEGKTTNSALKEFKPAFGRQEALSINGKNVLIFLSKNPTSFNESLRTVSDLGGKNILLILNDRIPDGRDVSWIWDVDFENFPDQFKNIYISGDRAYDMALRLKYADLKNFITEDDLVNAMNIAIKRTEDNGTLHILPTYSAMLDIRKILTGKKIL